MGTETRMEHIWKRIIDFGIKPMGSANLYQTGTYLQQVMKGICGQAQIHEYASDCREPVKWELTDEKGCQIEAYPFLDSGEGSFDGKLEDAGVHRIWDMYVWKRYMITGEDGNVQAYVTVRGNGQAIPQMLFATGSLPHLLVGREMEGKLRETAETGGKLSGFVCIRHPVHLVCRNVTGRLGQGNRKVILCAHYDTVYSTCGAYDNAAGTAVVLEVAQRIKEAYHLCTQLQFILMDGEEYNLRGSRFEASGDQEEILFVLNIDGVGRENVMEVWSGPETFERKLRSILSRSDEEFRPEYICPPPPGSDHAPYYEKGIDACMLTFNDQKILHLPEDVYEKSKLRNMEKMVRIVLEVLEGLQVIEKCKGEKL